MFRLVGLLLVGFLLVGRVPLVTGEEVVVDDLGVVEEGGAWLVKVGRGPNLGNWGSISEKPPEKWDDVCLFASFVNFFRLRKDWLQDGSPGWS